MKKTIFKTFGVINSEGKLWVVLLLFVLLLGGGFSLHGQNGHNIKGKVYIAKAGFVYVSSGDTMRLSGNITTVRHVDVLQRGMLSFAGTANWVSSNSSFVNGYVRSSKPDAFIFPIGEGSYRPAAISAASNIFPIDAAYYQSAQYSTTDLSNELIAVTNESWVIQGTVSAVITLSWSTALTSFVNDPEDLCIAGWDPFFMNWVEISSAIDVNSLIFDVASNLETKGSISTSAAIVPNSYAAYTLGAKNSVSLAPPSGGITIVNNDAFEVDRVLDMLEKELGGLRVYPNPTNGELRIENGELKMENERYCIFNGLGQMVMMGWLHGHTTNVNVGFLAKGGYYLQIGDKGVKFVKD